MDLSFLFRVYNMRFFIWCILSIGSSFQLCIKGNILHRYLRIQHSTNPTIQKLTRIAPTDPIVQRYLRIQHSTNPVIQELYGHIRGKVVSSFVPDSVLQDAIYECAEANQATATFFVKHLTFQLISHEIADYIHDAITHEITHTLS